MTDERERLAVLEIEVHSLKEDLAELKTDIRSIRDTLSQAKGGWKTLMLVAGVAGSLGAVASSLLPHIVIK